VVDDDLILNVAKIIQLASIDPKDSSRGFLQSLDECEVLALPIIDVISRKIIDDAVAIEFGRGFR